MALDVAYVVDTHALAWYFRGDPKLSDEARDVLERADRVELRVWVPSIVIVELMGIVEKGKLTLQDLAKMVARIATAPYDPRTGFAIAPLDEHFVTRMIYIMAQGKMSLFKDMHDLIIAATALDLGVKLITKDEKIRDSGLVSIVWAGASKA